MQEARRRRVVVEINLGVALVGRDHEVVLLRQFERVLQILLRRCGARGVAGVAQKQHFAAIPDVGRHGVEIGDVTVRCARVEEIRLRAGQQGRAFVDLVERVGHRHDRVLLGADDGLDEGEERLARAVHRQHHGFRAHLVGAQLEAAFQPLRDGRAQLDQTDGRGIAAEPMQVLAQRLEHERWRLVLRLADRHCHMGQIFRRRHACLQARELFKRIGVQ